MVSFNDIKSQRDKITELAERRGVRNIRVFGSFARGDADENSDLDLMIISDKEKNLPRYKRGLKLRIKLAEYCFKKDILFYTYDEIEKWEKVPNSFVNNVINEGVILYG